MNSSSRIIHISDTHCCRDQDTITKCNEIVDFLINNKEVLHTNRIVISGDIVDSAENDIYNAYAKQYLLDPLTSNGFDITITPGNHDYFNLGVQFWTKHIAEGAAIFYNAFNSYMKTSGPNAYPVDLDLGNGNHLIVINSLKGHYDVETDARTSTGNIGQQQMDWLKNNLPKYQQGRAAGNKIAMVLHHSPFELIGDTKITDAAEFLKVNAERGSTLELADAAGFLVVIANQIDALMFGHTGPPHQFYHGDASVNDYVSMWGIPVITSENIDKMSDDGYPISVIDLTYNEVELYNTKHALIAVEKGLPDIRVPVPLIWFATQ